MPSRCDRDSCWMEREFRRVWDAFIAKKKAELMEAADRTDKPDRAAEQLWESRVSINPDATLDPNCKGCQAGDLETVHSCSPQSVRIAELGAKYGAKFETPYSSSEVYNDIKELLDIGKGSQERERRLEHHWLHCVETIKRLKAELAARDSNIASLECSDKEDLTKAERDYIEKLRSDITALKAKLVKDRQLFVELHRYFEYYGGTKPREDLHKRIIERLNNGQ